MSSPTRIDRRIAVSEEARASAQRWLPGEYAIVPNGVIVPPEADAANRDDHVVFIGRHEPRKGMHIMLRAWPEIRRRTGARLRLVGADPLAVRLVLTRERVPDDGIDVLGALSNDDLTDELLRAKVQVASSLGGESFGMVLTRGLACAVPVVASDIPGYRAVLEGEAGVLVPPGDAGALADCRRRRARATRRRGSGAARRLARSRPSATRGTGSRGGCSRSTRRRPRERVARPGCASSSSSSARPPPSRSSGGAGPSWTDVSDAFTIVSWRWVVAAIALNLLSVVARVDVVADRDRPGGAAAARRLPHRLRRVLGRPVRERRPPGTDRRARARRRAQPADACTTRAVGDARRHRLRAPRVRPAAGPDADRIRRLHGEDPALGGCEPRRSSSSSGSGCSRSRSRARSTRTARRSTVSAPRGG